MKKKGQIWIETVIYTLIAFVMIGAVLTFAKPKIEEFQDKAIVEQSLAVMQQLDNLILEVGSGIQGNKRIRDISLKKGSLTIDGTNDRLIFLVEGKYAYSQPGVDIEIVSGIIARTEEIGNIKRVTLIKNYSGIYNIKFNGNDEIKTLEKSPTQYKLSFINESHVIF